MNPFMLHQTDECQRCATPVYWGEDTNIEHVVKSYFCQTPPSSWKLILVSTSQVTQKMTIAEQSDTCYGICSLRKKIAKILQS